MGWRNSLVVGVLAFAACRGFGDDFGARATQLESGAGGAVPPTGGIENATSGGTHALSSGGTDALGSGGRHEASGGSSAGAALDNAEGGADGRSTTGGAAELPEAKGGGEASPASGGVVHTDAGAGGLGPIGGAIQGGAGGAAEPPAADDCAVAVPGMACFRAASFIMGKPEVFEGGVRHEAAVGAFYLDLTEVTAGAYRKCVSESFCDPSVTDVPDSRCSAAELEFELYPLNCVSGRQASGYCASIGKRLPTEAEWEYAALAGHRTYPWGEQPPNASRVNVDDGWEAEPEWGRDGFPWLAPVNSFPAGATPEGVRHLVGNLWEWTLTKICAEDGKPCEKCSRPDLCSATCTRCEPTPFIARGGNFSQPANAPMIRQMLGHRGLGSPDQQVEWIGFRCAMDAPAR